MCLMMMMKHNAWKTKIKPSLAIKGQQLLHNWAYYCNTLLTDLQTSNERGISHILLMAISLHAFCQLLIVFFKSIWKKRFLSGISSVSNSYILDQTQGLFLEGVQLGRIQNDLSEGVQLGRIQNVLSEGVQLGRIQNVLSEGVQLGKIQNVLSEGVQLSRILNVLS